LYTKALLPRPIFTLLRIQSQDFFVTPKLALITNAYSKAQATYNQRFTALNKPFTIKQKHLNFCLDKKKKSLNKGVSI